MEKKNFDKRTVDRYIEKGLVKKADYESHLKALPDDSANAEFVEMEMDEAEYEGDEAAGSEELS